MPKFVIEPHFRLQEWIAEENGYFTAEGLDYEFREQIRSTGGRHHDMRATVRRLSVVRSGAQRRCQLRLPLDGWCRGRFRPW
jgi:hypothetical protein